jgi:Phosphotransferase enzyme family
MQPTEPEVANIARALKKLRSTPVAFRMVAHGGYTPARRWIVTLADRHTAFVKAATDELTASWIRDEHVIYSILRGSRFVPGYLGFFDDGEHPVLALEDLSAASWPPPWDRPKVDAVLEGLAAVASTPPPEGLLPIDEGPHGLREGWSEIRRDPTRFLGLGLCSAGWLERHLDALDTAAREAPLGGSSLLHMDVRSDNLCIRQDGSAVLVDWNWACVGNPACDVTFWLPSLELESGPAPEQVFDAPPGLVACVAGFMCSRAGLEPIPTAPRVRGAQLAQARTSLPWAARALGLPPPR